MGRSKSIINKQQENTRRQQFFEQLKSKPFWIWNKDEHKKHHAAFSGKCCFNHMIGLPEKNGIKMPLFDYQKEIIEALEQHRRLYVLKATSLGLTTLLLRYIAWICLKDDSMKGKNMVIVTGPRLELSVDLIRRMKALFSDASFESK